MNGIDLSCCCPLHVENGEMRCPRNADGEDGRCAGCRGIDSPDLATVHIITNIPNALSIEREETA